MSNFEYTAPWPVYALAWSPTPRVSRASTSASAIVGARLAIGSFVEEQANQVRVLGVRNARDGSGPMFDVLASTPHPYPPTKLCFQPASLTASPPQAAAPRYPAPSSRAAKRASWRGSMSAPVDLEEEDWPERELLATTADCLRVWECYRNEDAGAPTAYVGQRDQVRLPYALREKSVLAHVSSALWKRRSLLKPHSQSKNTSSPPAPLTSFSWNSPTPSLIVTSSIDTTCTIWDLPSRTALTQLIAHDREVFDVDWCPGSSDVFASVGADGSVRVFDLRSLEHSTIIYETGAPGGSSRPGTAGSTSRGVVAPSPLLRIAFNPWDANYLATFAADASAISILDVRAPGSPILELRGHQAAVNAVAWGPPGAGASKGMICTAGDDAQCLVYDLASATLRSASAQGRRSRNGAGPSPAPSSAMSTYSPSPAPSGVSDARGIAAEAPILAYSSAEMINNVAWLRPHERKSASGEWDEYAKGDPPREEDWLALTSGRTVRALKV